MWIPGIPALKIPANATHDFITSETTNLPRLPQVRVKRIFARLQMQSVTYRTSVDGDTYFINHAVKHLPTWPCSAVEPACYLTHACIGTNRRSNSDRIPDKFNTASHVQANFGILIFLRPIGQFRLKN